MPEDSEAAGLLLACIAGLDYPPERIVLQLCTPVVSAPLERVIARFRDGCAGVYAGVAVAAPQVGPEHRGAVLPALLCYALAKFKSGGTALLLLVGPAAFLRPPALRALVSVNLPIVTPLLLGHGPMVTNFAAEDDAVFRQLCRGELRGLIEVKLLREVWLIQRPAALRLTCTDFDAALSASARAQGIAQYLDNREVYGIVDRDFPRATRLRLMSQVALRQPCERRPIDTFILYGGIGDQLFWLSLLPEFRRHSAVPVTVVVAENAAYLAEMYAGRAYDRLDISGRVIDPDAAARHSLELGPNEMLAWHCYYGDASCAAYETLCLEHGIGIMDLLRVLLGLPSDCPTHPPIVPRHAAQQATARFRALGLPAGRTVLLSTGARTWPFRLAETWWIDAVACLTQAGFTVIGNTGDRGRGFDASGKPIETPALPGTTNVDIPLGEIIPFVECCGYFLGTISGLCNLLASARAARIFVFPSDPSYTEPTQRFVQFWSNRRAFSRTDIQETLVPTDAPFEAKLLTHWIKS